MSRTIYFNWCPTCGAEPRKPCRTLKTKRVTDTHAARAATTWAVHSAVKCEGEACVLHNPSDHHMADWPMSRRFDKRPPIVERLCPHGTGHPDPDSAAWAQRAVQEDDELVWQDERSDGEYVWIHGCDGCCAQDMVAS